MGDHWPFVIDWGTSPHPSEDAPGSCTLERLWVSDPEPGELRRLLEVLQVDGVDVETSTDGVHATLRSPAGGCDL